MIALPAPEGEGELAFIMDGVPDNPTVFPRGAEYPGCMPWRALKKVSRPFCERLIYGRERVDPFHFSYFWAPIPSSSRGPSVCQPTQDMGAKSQLPLRHAMVRRPITKEHFCCTFVENFVVGSNSKTTVIPISKAARSRSLESVESSSHMFTQSIAILLLWIPRTG